MRIKNDIIKKLNKLESYTENISVAAGLLDEGFVSNPLMYGGAVRYILLGICELRETTKLMCKEYSIEDCKGDFERLTSLAEKKIFPTWLAKNLYVIISEMSEMQCDDPNDKSELYGRLDGIVSDFRHYKKYVLEYLI